MMTHVGNLRLGLQVLSNILAPSTCQPSRPSSFVDTRQSSKETHSVSQSTNRNATFITKIILNGIQSHCLKIMCSSRVLLSPGTIN